MAQLVSYNFSIIENPLSDGGNFTSFNDGTFTDVLKVVAGNLCESNSATASCGSFWSGAVPGHASWPNDQYSEMRITKADSAELLIQFYLLLRAASAVAGTYYFINLQTGDGVPTVNADVSIVSVAGNSGTTLIDVPCSITLGDMWRASITGTTITVTRNGSVIATAVDSSIASGSPGFGLFADSNITRVQTNFWAAGAPSGSGGGLGTGTLMGNVIIDLDGNGFPIAESQVGTDA